MANPEGEEGITPKGTFGPGSKEDEVRALGDGGEYFFNRYRPLDNLRSRDVMDLKPHEKLQTEEALREVIMDGHLSLSGRLERGIERFHYAKLAYTVQHDVEMSAARVEQVESVRLDAPEGHNERLLGLTERELRRTEAAVGVFSWALPYKAKYYAGMESMALLSERGEQLALANMDRLLRGIHIKWLDDQPEEPEELEKLNKSKEVDEFFPLVEEGKTVSDRYARYVGDADFWMRAVGEMNTYDPTIMGEELPLSRTTQRFLADILRPRGKTTEDGVQKPSPDSTKIVVYLNADGEQLPIAPDGSPPPGGTRREAYIDILDYYNKAKTELDTRWVVSVISAMSILDAKGVLDSLPENLDASATPENDPNGSVYSKLFSSVQRMAQEMMDNYDMPRAKNLNHKLARSGFYLADAIAFGSFDIAERGSNNEWKAVAVGADGKPLVLPEGFELRVGTGGAAVIWDKNTNSASNITNFRYIWHSEPAQGDPTASGDAFTAARPYFHEVIYQAVKNRISANNSGVMLPIDSNEAWRMAKVFYSEAAEANDRSKIIKEILNGKHQHIAKYFGLLGAFKDTLGALPAWQEGDRRRIELKKEVNPNLSKAVEDLVVFIPTPFKDDAGESLLYPMIAHQFAIGLYDMLSAGKEITVGDLLRKTWKVEPDGKRHPASPEAGGKRLTVRDIDWLMYARYADDSRAVNDNFMLQLYAPLYGALNEKQLETVKKSPMAAITASIKAADIGLRWVVQKLKNPVIDPAHPERETGPIIKRPTLEIMHASSVAFQQLALGAHSVIGRGADQRYANFLKEINPRQKSEGMKDNLYTVLRNVEDFIGVKQGYAHYSDSFYMAFLAQAEALRPIVEASEKMASSTTKRMDSVKTTGYEKFVGDNKAFV